jgi:NitT/TauT family transport system substrate-binding protein
MKTNMLRFTLLAAAALASHAALAQETKVGIGISGWTGFAPLTLAKEAGIFKKNGLDVTISKIPQKDRHLACRRRRSSSSTRASVPMAWWSSRPSCASPT